MTTPTHSASADALDELRTAVRGRVVTGLDPDYDSLRTVLAAEVDAHPAAIVRVLDAADVAATIQVARTRGLELAVRSGGHSGAGHGTTEGGVVIDLRELRTMEIDPEGNTAWVGSGLTAGEVSAALSEHGLAIGFGDTGSVGVGGITLGGGVGYLVRKHGLTIDSLLGAEVVVADGRVLEVDERSHPDLFWAIRGGGGNFGVVTRFRFLLHEVPSIVGGILVLPATVDTVAGFMDIAGSAPDELSAIANVMPAPPMPFLPDGVAGELVVLAMVAWAGDPGEGEPLIGALRALAPPHADLLRSMPYVELFPPDDPDYRPLAESQTMFTRRIDRDAAATILDRLAASDASLRVAQLRPLGGAMARVPADATAFAHRTSPVMVNVAAFYDGAEDRPRRARWVAELAAALDQGEPGAYVNFLTDGSQASMARAYPPATLGRLVEAKTRWDPDNLFHRNVNVAPVGG